MKHTNIIHNHECVSLWVRKSLTGFGCISGWRSGVPDAICMRAGPRDEKYVEISHSPPGWHVMCNKTEFMFPQNLNTFLAGTVPRGSGLRRNLNKKSSATLAVNCTQLRRAGAREYRISFIWCDCAPVCGAVNLSSGPWGQHRPGDRWGGLHACSCHKAAVNASIILEHFFPFSLLILADLDTSNWCPSPPEEHAPGPSHNWHQPNIHNWAWTLGSHVRSLLTLVVMNFIQNISCKNCIHRYNVKYVATQNVTLH